jgi:hypothetical protein
MDMSNVAHEGHQSEEDRVTNTSPSCHMPFYHAVDKRGRWGEEDSRPGKAIVFIPDK